MLIAPAGASLIRVRIFGCVDLYKTPLVTHPVLPCLAVWAGAGVVCWGVSFALVARLRALFRFFCPKLFRHVDENEAA